MKRSGVPWLGADDKRLRHWIGKKRGIKGRQSYHGRRNRGHMAKQFSLY
ncbi:hypothetical protein [Brevibacillus reuszeri]|nr:hypothetical protein [Brevibacillus reuszeri]